MTSEKVLHRGPKRNVRDVSQIFILYDQRPSMRNIV